MKYYAFIKDNKIIGIGQAKLIQEDIENLLITEEVYNAIKEYGNNYYLYDNEELILNLNYEEEKRQKAREELDRLSLTGADVERAIYKAKGMDFEDIVEFVKNNSEIDIKALKIELKANNFYRGNMYINQIGTLLGYTNDDLDYLFKNKKLPNKSVTVEGDSLDKSVTVEGDSVNNEI